MNRHFLFRYGFFSLALFSLAFCFRIHAATATIEDAWWTFQQDCDGDSCKAGTLPGDVARLNWDPNVTNCTGTLTVFEKVYSKPCSSNSYTLIYSNAPHVITGCPSSDQQFVDIPMLAGCGCRDYKIEIYRSGTASPDYTRLPSNDPDLNDQSEESLAQDTCASDNFATPEVLAGSYGSDLANTTSATKEPAEPDHAGNAGGKSLWYSWTPTITRQVTFDTLGTDFDTLLAIYTGNILTNLSLVASNDDIAGANNRQSKVTFNAINGTTYRIAVDGFGGASGNLVLNWLQTNVALPDLIIWGGAASPYITTETFPSNDCEVTEGCITAGTRRLLRFGNETRNIGSGDLVIGSPVGNPLFHFATCHGHYHFEDFAVYRLLDTNGVVAATGGKVGFCVEDVDQWSPTAPHQNAFYDCGNQGLSAGWADVYRSTLACQYIDVTDLPPGNYTLELEVDPENLLPESNEANNTVQVSVVIPDGCTQAPPNDNFTNRIALTNLPPITVSQLTECATKQTGEPNHAGDDGGHSIWYSWTPDVTGTAIISTEGSGFDTLLAVYRGTNVSSLTVVANNDDIGGGNVESRVTFTAMAGTNYQIAIDGFKRSGEPGAVGLATLNINPPGNDSFAGRYTISGTSGTTNNSNVGATKENDEPAHASNVGGHSVWYSWIAPTNGAVEFNTVGSSFDTVLGIYSGTDFSNLVSAASDNNSGPNKTSRAGFMAVAGTPYRIAVDGYAGATGDILLNWNMNSLLNTVNLPNGQVQVVLTGVNGQRYQILTSTNLTNWSLLTILSMSGGAQTYSDPPTAAQKFYRAVLVP